METSEQTYLYSNVAGCNILDDEIGRGQFGTVYKAKLTQGEKVVAVKRINYITQGKTNNELKRRGQIEVEICKTLQGHKNIIEFLESQDDDMSIWIAMEFCSEGDLCTFLSNSTVDVNEKLKIMKQCCSAIGYMHSFQPPIVHRDIKPQNILIQKDGNSNVVKVVDSGLGKLSEETELKEPNPMMNTLAGSHYYMAPEFYATDGELAYKYTVDIFALGLVFFFLLEYNGDLEFRPTPVTAFDTKLVHPLGLEMAIAEKEKRPMPQLFSRKSSNPLMSKIHEIIEHMLRNKEDERLHLNDVEVRLGHLTDGMAGLDETLQGVSETEDKIQWMSQPDWLLKFSEETGNIEINKNICDQLRKIRYKVEVISIGGKCRTGKSYLLNRLIGEKKGFALGKHIDPKTRGMWIWIKPHPYHTRTALMLLDSEGLQDIKKKHPEQDEKIFTLALMLSSTFVYNIEKHLDRDDFTELNIILGLVDKILIHPECEEKTRSCLSLFTPKLRIVVRNNQYDCEDPDEYLNQIMTVIDDNTQQINDIIKEIATFFPMCRRSLNILDFPVENSKLLKMTNLDEIDEDKLSEDFVKQFDKLINVVLNEGNRFAIFSEEVMIPGWVIMLEECVKALNTNKQIIISDLIKQVMHYEQQIQSEKREEIPWPKVKEMIKKCQEEEETRSSKTRIQQITTKQAASFAKESMKYQTENKSLAQYFNNLRLERLAQLNFMTKEKGVYAGIVGLLLLGSVVRYLPK